MLSYVCFYISLDIFFTFICQHETKPLSLHLPPPGTPPSHSRFPPSKQSGHKCCAHRCRSCWWNLRPGHGDGSRVLRPKPAEAESPAEAANPRDPSGVDPSGQLEMTVDPSVGQCGPGNWDMRRWINEILGELVKLTRMTGTWIVWKCGRTRPLKSLSLFMVPEKTSGSFWFFFLCPFGVLLIPIDFLLVPIDFLLVPFDSYWTPFDSPSSQLQEPLPNRRI